MLLVFFSLCSDPEPCAATSRKPAASHCAPRRAPAAKVRSRASAVGLENLADCQSSGRAATSRVRSVGGPGWIWAARAPLKRSAYCGTGVEAAEARIKAPLAQRRSRFPQGLNKGIRPHKKGAQRVGCERSTLRLSGVPAWRHQSQGSQRNPPRGGPQPGYLPPASQLLNPALQGMMGVHCPMPILLEKGNN